MCFTLSLSLSYLQVCVYIYIYIYMYIHTDTSYTCNMHADISLTVSEAATRGARQNAAAGPGPRGDML